MVGVNSEIYILGQLLKVYLQEQNADYVLHMYVMLCLTLGQLNRMS